MQNKPNLKSKKNAVSDYSKTVYCLLMTVNWRKSKPKQTHFSKPPTAKGAIGGFTYVPLRHPKQTQFKPNPHPLSSLCLPGRSFSEGRWTKIMKSLKKPFVPFVSFVSFVVNNPHPQADKKMTNEPISKSIKNHCK